ncbi:valine--tRNA ligase [Rickettsia endosymbiont of Cardiosporidium cionae]|uniref:valine--tRNA ligase n=1 Tax=Rickettsia endosymbiont of Cardiosporidium cionae TaxID=2777155 RepID=UPI001894F330|nr:valine--tRNA ligase [Rickettsia endosymbiont of Cardiosporidium cionae]KAF8818923.1 valine--tRNA ligase [Rickettsia endosymbiont of Cardiosporidium cionae]
MLKNYFTKKYNFDEYQNEIKDFWQQNKLYEWDPNNTDKDKTYIVDTPPPNVSGKLHIGHVYSYSHSDFIVRYKRMQGMNVFYPMGYDDNGLPTERLVEKVKQIKASKVDTSEFIKNCKEVIIEEEKKFYNIFNKIGLSLDWQNEYKTISPLAKKISQMSFLDLVKKQQVYRATQPILWDTIDQTALSQAEIVEKEESTLMNYITFQTTYNIDIVIATTRPELLPACAAIFIHPDDNRFKHLIGYEAITPLFKVKIPILSDELVEQNKGTGIVMCCSFGDQLDLIWYRKHNLISQQIINKYGIIEELQFNSNSLDPAIAQKYMKPLAGLKVLEARDQIIKLLYNSNLIVKQEKIIHKLKVAERSGGTLEFLNTPQWFLKTIAHKEAILKKIDEINWYPQEMKVKLQTWVKSLSWDWCISRQRYFGVNFPVWYSKRTGEANKVIFAEMNQLPIDPSYDLPSGYTREEVIADVHVMDTWATSSLSPQINSHGVSSNIFIDKERHQKIFPADLRVQAHDIIRTWAFYTILKSYLHQESIPWKNIVISGWCLAEDKSKMSKSKGNIITPDKLLEDFGADPIRYWAAKPKLGSDATYSLDTIKIGKKLVNKLWNAASLINSYIININQEFDLTLLIQNIYCEIDKYLIFKLQKLIQDTTEEFEKFQYSSALNLVEHFFWQIFCDQYLEITKIRSYNQNNSNILAAKSAVCTLLYSFEILLKLFAPFLPYITEIIYQKLFSKNLESIHAKNTWPENETIITFKEIKLVESEYLIKILELVRKLRSKLNLSMNSLIKKIQIFDNKNHDISMTDDLLSDLQNVTSSSNIEFIHDTPNIEIKNEKAFITEDNMHIKFIF